jgi:hypothetical protein
MKPGPRLRFAAVVVGTGTAAALASIGLAGCGDPHPAPPKLIPQPPLTALNARTRRRLAPETRRVDLVAPSFSSASVTITNPLFPVSRLHSAILVGRLGGVPWRAETTLLPQTETVSWNGARVRTVRSQFVAYLGGRIFEVAVDRYAQADDGSVWYLGEDAYTYDRGRVADTEGTWLAGKDGPPALIMPAHPRVGDVYRTENIPGLVFEQVTVEKTDQTVSGPTGPVHGAMVGRELHMDEARLERKVFAPGYGEFFSGGGRTFEATALVVPANSVATRPPSELKAIFHAAVGLIAGAAAARWPVAAFSATRIQRAETALIMAGVPARLGTELARTVATLARTVAVRDTRRAQLAALDVASASLDLQLQYRPPASIDAARLRLWALRAASDARAGDRPGVRGDLAALGWIRDRIVFPPVAAARIDGLLRRLRTAAKSGRVQAVIAAEVSLRKALGPLGAG